MKFHTLNILLILSILTMSCIASDDLVSSQTAQACYSYQTDDDIKNIARNAIIEKFGKKTLIAQKNLIIIHKNYSTDTEQGLIVISGEPRSYISKLFSLILNDDYIPTVGVTLRNKGNCLSVVSVLYLKD